MMVKNYFKKNGFGGADKVPAQESHRCSNQGITFVMYVT